jgi:hypothetical protein
VSPEGQIVWQFHNFTENLQDALVNGGFEDPDADGMPAGWYRADLNAEGVGSFIWDGTDRIDGQRSASLEYHDQGRLAWLQTVRVKPGQIYHFEGWLKGRITSGAFAFQLWFVDELGGPLGDQPITAGAHDRSANWTHDAVDVTAPGDAAALQVWIISQADGRVWADNLTLTPVSSPARSSIGWIAPVGIGVALVVAVVWRRQRTGSRRLA